MNRLDSSLFRAVNRLADRTPWAHGAMVGFAKVGIVAFAVLLVVGWWEARASVDLDQMAGVLWAGAAAVVAFGLNQVLGSLVGRARPYATLGNVHVLVPRTTDFSFPSDHAVAAGAVAAGLLLASRRLGGIAAVLAVLMAVARVYVGAHYPGDVAAGLLVGAVVAVLGAVVCVPPLRTLVGVVDRSRLRALTSAGEREPLLRDS